MTARMVKLPTYHTSLIGRAADLVDLTDRLRDPATRLLTLVGASGSGKTRLALEVATSLVDHFASGVVFVALAPVQDARFVLSTIAAALEIKEEGQTPLLETLSAALADRHLLLVLDNIEQVRDAVLDLEALLAAAPGLTIFVTSQVPLDAPAEHLYMLPPLDLPPDDAPRDPAALLAYAAVALFVERLTDVQPRFRLSPATAEPVVAICRLLQGYPLAIELVAAHSAALAPADLLVLLRNHLRLLPTSSRDAVSSRSAVLHPVLDWCAGRLPAATRQLFEQVGVFWGGWTADAAHAVLAPELDVQTVLEMLAVLVQKHMVLVETLPGQGDRYVVLDAVHEYSATRMARRRQDVRLGLRHAEYYGALAAAAKSKLEGPEQGATFKQLDEEIHNLRAAVQWLTEHGQPLPAVQLLTATHRFWQTRAYYTEARAWLEPMLPEEPIDALSTWGDGWGMVGWMALLQGLLADAERAFARALDLYRRIEDWSGQGRAANGLGIVFTQRRDLDMAVRMYQQGLDAHARAPEPDVDLMNRIRFNLANVYSILGEYARANAIYEETLVFMRQSGNLILVCTVLSNLLSEYAELGQLERAYELWEECRPLAEQFGNTSLLLSGYINLSLAATDHEAYAEAAAQLAAAQALVAANPTPRFTMLLDYCAGTLALAQEQWDAAEHRLSAALANLEATGSSEVPRIYVVSAMLAWSQQDYGCVWAMARRYLELALSNHSQPHLIRGAEVAAAALAGSNLPAASRLWQAAAAARAAIALPQTPWMQRWYAAHAGPLAALPAAVPAAELRPAVEEALAAYPTLENALA